MAKKKKHRKTRKQKQAHTQNQHQSAVVATTKLVEKTQVSQDEQIEVVNKQPLVTPEEAEMNAYVKSDVIRSLVLVGIILVVFAVLYVVLEHTSVGTQVFKIIKI